MALNASSHNAAGIPTQSTPQPPPPPSSETKQAILGAAQTESTGQSAPGKDVSTVPPQQQPVRQSVSSASGSGGKPDPAMEMKHAMGTGSVGITVNRVVSEMRDDDDRHVVFKGEKIAGPHRRESSD